MSLLYYAPAPPAPLFSAAFRAETEKGVLREGSPEIYPVLKLGLPTGTVTWGSVALSSAARGRVSPRVLQFGSVAPAVDERTPNLVAIECSPRITDRDRDFARLVGTYRSSLRRSTAEVVLLSPNVPDADAFVAFRGVLDSWKLVQPAVWSLRLRPDDLQLRLGKVPRVPVTAVDWPNADSQAVGSYWPVLYGHHDSTGLTGKGMIPTLYVDTVGFRYGVALGANSVPRVFKDGVLVTSGYSITKVTVNGTLFTLVDFTTTQGASAITVDADGLTDKPDGTGSLILNPALQLFHFLTNFGFNDWRSGAYFDPDTTTSLNAPSFALTADFLSAQHEGSKYIGGDTQEQLDETLSTWSESHRLHPFWTFGGELAIKPFDHRFGHAGLEAGGYGDTRRWVRPEKVTSFESDHQSGRLIRRVSVQYVFGQTDGRYFQTQEVEDLSVPENVLSSAALAWSAARIV